MATQKLAQEPLVLLSPNVSALVHQRLTPVISRHANGQPFFDRFREQSVGRHAGDFASSLAFVFTTGRVFYPVLFNKLWTLDLKIEHVRTLVEMAEGKPFLRPDIEFAAHLEDQLSVLDAVEVDQVIVMSKEIKMQHRSRSSTCECDYLPSFVRKGGRWSHCPTPGTDDRRFDKPTGFLYLTKHAQPPLEATQHIPLSA